MTIRGCGPIKNESLPYGHYSIGCDIFPQTDADDEMVNFLL